MSRMMPQDGTVTAIGVEQLSDALILSIIDYGFTIWCPTWETWWNKLTSLYLTPMRKCLGLPFSTHRDWLCVELGIVRLEIKREMRIIMETQRLTKKNMWIVREDVEIILKEITEGRNPFDPSVEHNNQITNAMNLRSEWGPAMDLANPIFHTTKEKTKKTARRKMNHQRNFRGKRKYTSAPFRQ